MADSPAASATIGMNLTTSKILVFALSGAIAGFAGAMLGLSTGALSVNSFPLFAGLPLVLLLAVQGVRYPVAAFLGVRRPGLCSRRCRRSPGNPSWLTSISLIGPGLAAITMAYQARGGGLLRRAGHGRAAAVASRRHGRRRPWPWPRLAPSTSRGTRSAISGSTRPFTLDKVAQLDRVLHVADELAQAAIRERRRRR